MVWCVFCPEPWQQVRWLLSYHAPFSIAPWLSEAKLKSHVSIGCVSLTPCWQGILPYVLCGLWIFCKWVFINHIISCLALLYSHAVVQYLSDVNCRYIEFCTMNSWHFNSTPLPIAPTCSFSDQQFACCFTLISISSAQEAHLRMRMWDLKSKALAFTCVWEKWWVILGRHCIPSNELISGLMMTVMLILTPSVEGMLCLFIS
jgi:hypothetical protein